MTEEAAGKPLDPSPLACSRCDSQALKGSYYALYSRVQWEQRRKRATIPLGDGSLERRIFAAWSGLLPKLNPKLDDDDFDDTPEWDLEFEQLMDVELQLTCSACGHKQQIDASPLGSVCTGDEGGSERAAQIRAPWQSSLSFPGDAPAPGSDDHASAATLACPCCEAPVLLVGESVLRQEEAGKQYGSVDLSEASGATAAEKLASGLTSEEGHTNYEGDLELIIPAEFGFRVGMRCSQFSCWSAEGIRTAEDASALILAVAALAQVSYGPCDPGKLRQRCQRAGITEEQHPATIDQAIKWLDCAGELSAESGAPVPLTQERQGSAQGLLRQLAPKQHATATGRSANNVNEPSRDMSAPAPGSPFADVPRDATELSFSNKTKLTSLEGIGGLVSLTSLDLSGCTALKSLAGLEGLVNLTGLNLSGCSALKSLAGLEGLTNLTSLNLSGCTALKSLEPAAGLTRLYSLNLSGCEQLSSLKALRELWKLKRLDLSANTILTSLEGIDALTCLRELKLQGCSALESLSGIESLTNLFELNLDGCRALRSLEPIASLRELHTLVASDCQALTSLDPLKDLGELRDLYLRNLGIEGLSGLEGLNLRDLRLDNCRSLLGIEAIRDMCNMGTLSLRGCESLASIDGLEELEELVYLYLDGCQSLSSLEPLRQLLRSFEPGHSLYELSLPDGPWLEDLGALLESVPVGELTIQHCTSLKSLDGAASLDVTDLDLKGCTSLASLSGLKGNEHLETLNVAGCSALESFKLQDLGSLRQIVLLDTDDFEDTLLSLPPLVEIDITSCPSLESIWGLHVPSSAVQEVKKLRLEDCSGLIELDGIFEMNQLSSLTLKGCTNLTTLTRDQGHGRHVFSYQEMTDFCERRHYESGVFSTREEVESFLTWLQAQPPLGSAPPPNASSPF